MDDTSQTNLISLSSFDLNLKFNDRCHTDWSKSNLISLVNQEGIYIIKLQLEDNVGPFHIDVIKNIRTRFHHQEAKLSFAKFDTMWHILNNHQYMEAYLDPALTTNIEFLSPELYPRRFRLAKWSPLIDVYPRQCILAAITVDFQLLIYGHKMEDWAIEADLSNEYDKVWFQKNHSKQNQKGFDHIRHSLHSLSFCNVCWKEVKGLGPILVAVTITGDIVIWQVQIALVTPGYQLKFNIKTILQTNLEFINGMQFFDSLLIVSARDGQVVLYDLTPNLSQTVEPATLTSRNHKASKKAQNVISILPTATLWHCDNIEVSDFFIQPLSPSTFRICLAKLTNVCWCIINYAKRTESGPATLSISDSFSAIDGLDPDVSLHQTQATWLRPAGNSKAVLIADDGSFFQLEFVQGRQDESPDCSSIRTGKVNLSCMVPRGLCTSPQGNMILLVSSVSFVYERAKISAPTKLLALPIKNDRTFFDDCLGKMLDESWLAQESIESTMDVSDRLDYIRSLLPLMNSQDFNNLFNNLRTVILDVGLLTNDIQLVKLKISTFLMRKLLENINSKFIDTNQQIDLDERSYNVILLYEIEKILKPLFGPSTTRRGSVDARLSLNQEQINSLRNYFEWLSKSPKRSHVRDQFIDKFKEFNLKNKIVPNETCHICETEIPFEYKEHGSCSNGHMFDRCARTLLLLDMRINHHACNHCGHRFLNNLIWTSPKKLWLCLYCQ